MTVLGTGEAELLAGGDLGCFDDGSVCLGGGGGGCWEGRGGGSGC